MCDHLRVNLKGNDETGLQSISCGDCGRQLTRRFDASGTGYVYELHPDERADALDGFDRDGGALEDADAAAMDRWARAYDELNGAPENDDDR